MSFELHERKHIEEELTKIVRQQLKRAARKLTTSAGSEFQSAVHESRKSVKKVRAVAAFLTQAGAKLPRRDRKRLKSAARALSRVRDSTAIIDTFDRVRRRYPKQLPEHTYGILRRGLVAARDRSEARAQREGVVAEAAKRLEKTPNSLHPGAAAALGTPPQAGQRGSGFTSALVRHTFQYSRDKLGEVAVRPSGAGPHPYHDHVARRDHHRVLTHVSRRHERIVRHALPGAATIEPEEAAVAAALVCRGGRRDEPDPALGENPLAEPHAVP
jgi:CHAD domain-containing protein